MNMLKINSPDYPEIYINIDHVMSIRVDCHDEEYFATFRFIDGTTERFDLGLYPNLLDGVPAVAIDYDHEEVRERQKAAEAEAKEREEKRLKWEAEREARKAASQ